MSALADLARFGPLPPSHQFRGFLDESERAALLDWALSNRDRFRTARLRGKVVDPTVRIAEKLGDLGPLAAVIERRVFERLDEIFRHSGTRPFRPDHVELELAAHGDGAFFKAHTDIPVGPGRAPLGGDGTGRHDRLVSAVYYFHREPKGFSGGALRLYRFGDKDCEADFAEYQPEQNSLLVFPSWARHEVRPVSCPGGAFEDYRFAVNIWLCSVLEDSSAQRPPTP